MIKDKNIFLFSLGVIYCLVFGYLLFAAPFRADTYTEINIVPFNTLYQDIQLAIMSPPSTQYVLFTFGAFLGNLFLLFPVPTLFQFSLKTKKLWFFALGIPILLELIQYAFQVGSADIDDVILNSTGAFLGARITRKN